MNVKRFTAPTSRDALKQVRLAFGREAVELLTQNYHGSARAVLSTYVTELAAARLGN